MQDANNGWPYKTIQHWPPMTYRDRALSTSSVMSDFAEFLKTGSTIGQTRELQPWIPFCEGKCAFCYFPVSCDKQSIPPYLAAMKKALCLYAQNKYVSSSLFSELYIGGGSPTVLANDQIVDILDFCRENFNFEKDHQTKVAACTTNLSESKIRLLSSQKVNQLDIGVQTFDDSFRKILMLRDSKREVATKLRSARKQGLGVSVDLIYNLPGQTLSQWKADIEQALELELESVDCYPLDLYPDTFLAKKIESGELPPTGDDKVEIEMYLEASNIFRKNGYYPTCHNRFSRVKEDFNRPSSEVVGSGAGFFMGHIGSFLYSDIENIQAYIEAVGSGAFPIERVTKLSVEDEMRKEMMLIYIRVPVDRHVFQSRFGKLPEDVFPEAIHRLQEKGLIETKDGKIQLTQKGDPWRFNIAWEFFNNYS
ncbi:MAG: coproporphyrinogen-III oxidase family protein [Candidatus Bathyarchaeia archaeon]